MPTIVQGWFEEDMEKGVEKGKYEAKLETLNQIIMLQFQINSGHYAEYLGQLDLQTLTQLTKVVLQVDDLSAFDQALKQHL